MPAIKDKKTGKFKRIHKIWNEQRWNDGFINNKNRFIVYYPMCSRILYEGYALRSYVVWERRTGKKVPRNRVIHHKNKNKLDDRFENLELLTKKAHDLFHKNELRKGFYLTCEVCKKLFYKPKWRMNQRGHCGKYCTRKCRNSRKYNR